MYGRGKVVFHTAIEPYSFYRKLTVLGNKLDNRRAFAITRRDKKSIWREKNRRRSIDIGTRLPGMPPQESTISGSDTDQTRDRKKDDLPDIRHSNRNRRSIRRSVILRSPGNLASGFIKSNKSVSRRTPNLDNQQIAFYQRRSRKAPMGRITYKFSLKMVRPYSFSAFNIEGIKLSVCT